MAITRRKFATLLNVREVNLAPSLRQAVEIRPDSLAQTLIPRAYNLAQVGSREPLANKHIAAEGWPLNDIGATVLRALINASGGGKNRGEDAMPHQIKHTKPRPVASCLIADALFANLLHDLHTNDAKGARIFTDADGAPLALQKRGRPSVLALAQLTDAHGLPVFPGSLLDIATTDRQDEADKPGSRVTVHPSSVITHLSMLRATELAWAPEDRNLPAFAANKLTPTGHRVFGTLAPANLQSWVAEAMQVRAL